MTEVLMGRNRRLVPREPGNSTAEGVRALCAVDGRVRELQLPSHISNPKFLNDSLPDAKLYRLLVIFYLLLL